MRKFKAILIPITCFGILSITFGSSLPLAISPINSNLSKNTLNLQQINNDDYYSQIKTAAEDPYPDIFLQADATMSLQIETYMILENLLLPSRNVAKTNDVLICPAYALYDYQTKTTGTSNLKYDYNSLINWSDGSYQSWNDSTFKDINRTDNPSRSQPSNVPDPDGNVGIVSRASDWLGCQETTEFIVWYVNNFFDLLMQNLLSFYNDPSIFGSESTNKFNIFINYQVFSYYWNSFSHSNYLWPLIRHANKIYLTTDGSAEWTNSTLGYANFTSTCNYDESNYDTLWNQIQGSDDNDSLNAFSNSVYYYFIADPDKMRVISCISGNYWTSTYLKSQIKNDWPIGWDVYSFDFDYANVKSKLNINGTLFSYFIQTLRKYFNLDNIWIDGNYHFNNFFIKSTPDVVVPDTWNQFDPNKKSLLFILGYEWTSINTVVVNELKSAMQQYMNLYPPNDFNYLLKLHPRTSLNDSIDSTKNIIGDNAPICIFNSNLPFELILSNDLEYASEHDNKGYLFEDDGAGDFSFKTAIAGWTFSSTSYITINSIIHNAFPTKEIKKLANNKLNFIPETFLIGIGTFATNAVDQNKNTMYSCLFPFMDGDSNLNLLSPSAFTTISSFTNVPYPTYFEQYIHEGKLWCIISVAFITPIGISIIALNKYWHRKKYVHKI